MIDVTITIGDILFHPLDKDEYEIVEVQDERSFKIRKINGPVNSTYLYTISFQEIKDLISDGWLIMDKDKIISI